jgi:hypothetical protein
MRRALLASTAVLAIAGAALAQSPPPWGPGALPTQQNWLGFWANKQDVQMKINPSFLSLGLDGTPQGGVGYSWHANAYCLFQGSFYGGSPPPTAPSAANGAVVCQDGTVTDDVNANIVAENNGYVQLVNGWGVMAEFISPGGNQLDVPFQFTAANPSVAADITANGAAPTLGGSKAITFANLGQTYSLNANPDFWFDQINAGQLNTTTSNGPIADGWNVTNTQAAKLTYQKVALSSIGEQLSDANFAEQINVNSSYTPISTDAFGIVQNMSNGEVGYLNLGTSLAGTFNDTLCILPHNVTVSGQPISATNPFVLAVSYGNYNAGSPNRTYVTTDNLTASGGWTCFNNVVPGDVTGTWNNLAASPSVGMRRWIDFTGSTATTRATSTLNTWQTGNFLTSTTANSLVSQANGAYFLIARARLAPGAVQLPYSPLAYNVELGRARNHVFSTFAPGTRPAQAVGINKGEIQFPATVAGANANIVSIPIPAGKESTSSLSTSAFYNPASANANVRDETAGADGGACSVTAWTAYQITLSCIGNSATAVGNTLGVGLVLDAM